MVDPSERSRLNRAELLSAVTGRLFMTRIAVFCLASATLAALAVPASGGDSGKLKAAGTVTNKQIQAPTQGDINRPYVIGGVYNGGGNVKVQPGKSYKVRAPPH